MDQRSSSAPPAALCLLRTSAIGDVTHVVPLVRTLQRHWPETAITWLIGTLEHKLIGDLEGVEFIVFDKRKKGRAARAAVREALGGRRFDALLHMQVAWRANLLSRVVDAPLRIGYDRARSKDLTRCPPACSRGALLIGAAFPERHLDFDVALFGGATEELPK